MPDDPIERLIGRAFLAFIVCASAIFFTLLIWLWWGLLTCGPALCKAH